MSAANPLNPFTVRGGRLARSGAWCWAVVLWFLFFCYCIFTLIQAIQKTQTPIQTTSYTMDSGFMMPSVLLCSFGQYNLDSFTAEYPTLFAGNFWVQHTYEDLLSPGLANHTEASNATSFTDANFDDAYGHNNLITFSENCGNMSNLRGLPHLSLNSSGFCNFSTPQLMGLIRSAAINESSEKEEFNQVTKTRWCVMWTPYRLTLDYPPGTETSNASLDTGSADARQLDSRDGYRLSISLNGTAIMEEQALSNVHEDDGSTTPAAERKFPHTMSVKFIEFSGRHEEEWRSDSQSSQYLKQALTSGDPDGFELLSLDNHYEMSVQKVVTTKLSSAQKLGWPWAPWPWSDESPYQSTSFQMISSTQLPYQISNGPHSLALCMLRSTKMVLQIADVPVVYGFFGNIGGALSLVVVLYGCFYAIKSYSPVETEFELQGVTALQKMCSWVGRKITASWRCLPTQRNAQSFWPLRLQSQQSISVPEAPKFEMPQPVELSSLHRFDVAQV